MTLSGPDHKGHAERSAGERAGTAILVLLPALLVNACSAPRSDEAEMLKHAMAAQFRSGDDTCIDSASNALPEHRRWADILFVEGGRGYLMAPDPAFEQISRRYYRSSARGTSMLPRPVPSGKSRVSFGPGWWNALMCDYRISYFAPLFDRDMAFVVADTPQSLDFWVFVQRGGRWRAFASGHASKNRVQY